MTKDQVYTDNFDKSLTVKSKPDIYYIILDGYARGDVFKTVYDFDNSNFYKDLINRGFIIADKSRANYSSTLLSLSSSLNMRYHETMNLDLNTMSNFTKILSEQIANSRVANSLRNIGYKFITLSSGVIWTEIKNSDLYITPKFSFDEFENMIIGTTPFRSLLQLIPKISPYYLHSQRILFNLDQIPKISGEGFPVFIFAHILAPHPPFVFADRSLLMDSTTIVNYDDGSYYHNSKDSLRQDYKNKYVSQVKFINNKVIAMINKLINKTGEKIIIIQSDHGPAALLDWENPSYQAYRERLPILNAFYFPKDKKVKPYNSITSVNTFRFIFNNFFNGKFELLEDRSYFSKWSKPYNFIPVDDAFNTQQNK